MKFTIPLRTKSAPNLREHWAVKAKRVKAERNATWWAWLGEEERPEPPCVVTLTRIAPRTLDGDNWQAGAKAVRDEIARLMRVNDADPRVTWAYAQERGKPREYAVRVEIVGAVPAGGGAP